MTDMHRLSLRLSILSFPSQAFEHIKGHQQTESLVADIAEEAKESGINLHVLCPCVWRPYLWEEAMLL